MAVTKDKFYLHVTAVPESVSIKRRPFGNLTLDDLPPLVGDRSGNCHLGLTYRYFPNPLFLIVNDDEFSGKDWPVTAVINDRWFRGAFVVLAERPRDVSSPDDTFLDGLTTDECAEARRWIGGPPGTPWPKSVFKNRSRY